MKTRSMIAVLAAALIAALLMLGGCSAPAEEPDGGKDATDAPATSEDDVVAEGEQVAGSVCLECHSEMAFTAAFVGGPQEGLDWDMVIQRMQETHEVVLTDDEANAVVQYLASREPSEAETLIAEKCSDCHSLEKVYQAENGTSWLDVVSRMQESHGLELTSEEQEAILDFLEQ